MNFFIFKTALILLKVRTNNALSFSFYSFNRFVYIIEWLLKVNLILIQMSKIFIILCHYLLLILLINHILICIFHTMIVYKRLLIDVLVIILFNYLKNIFILRKVFRFILIGVLYFLLINLIIFNIFHEHK